MEDDRFNFLMTGKNTECPYYVWSFSLITTPNKKLGCESGFNPKSECIKENCPYRKQIKRSTTMRKEFILYSEKPVSEIDDVLDTNISRIDLTYKNKIKLTIEDDNIKTPICPFCSKEMTFKKGCDGENTFQCEDFECNKKIDKYYYKRHQNNS
jgi:hypothetical protein